MVVNLTRVAPNEALQKKLVDETLQQIEAIQILKRVV